MNYGLIAERVGHSFSAEIHKKLFGYDYELKAIEKDELESFLKNRDFKAINVTIPYKEAVINHLDYVNPDALEIGAVNTIVNSGGRLYGFNTDSQGLALLLKRESIDLTNKKVLILGSGGTSKTALYVAKNSGCKSVFRVSRSQKDGCVTYDDAKKMHADADVIINTTPCGMYPDNGVSAIEIDDFSSLSAVVDVVYNPLRSKLIIDAQKKGIKAVGGLYMLVAQAAKAAEHFVEKIVEIDKIEEIYREILRSKLNVVIIGMPGCGKTSTGKLVAQSLGFEFVDSDLEIYKKTAKYPHEIINESGENAFRIIESEVIKEISKRQGIVISTGGGAILRSENVDALRANGRIYFLDRPLEELRMTSDRPLSSDFESLKKRYLERYDIYTSSCDKQIFAVDGKQLNANAILEDYLNEDSCN